jgi:hypothetical protein
LRLILCRVRQRRLVLEHLAEIAAVNQAVAGRAPDEVLGLVAGHSPSSSPMYRGTCGEAAGTTDEERQSPLVGEVLQVISDTPSALAKSLAAMMRFI